jgi:DnaJ-class molecular chaperone
MDKISDPNYCSLCKGTGVEKNTAKEIFGGPDGRTCPMCEGTGKRSY